MAENLTILAALAIIGFASKRTFHRATIFHYQRGLHYRKGRFLALLQPGQYWYCTYFTTISPVDIRRKYVSVVGQEILSADNVALKLSFTVSYEYSDLQLAFTRIQSVDEAAYLEVQHGAREIIGAHTIDELLTKRKEIAQSIHDACVTRFAALGLQLHSLAIKDITFPGELKKIFTEVVRAQKEGLAALERARGESAALRNLANAAKLIEGNQALMHLRIIHSIDATRGNTIVFGAPPPEKTKVSTLSSEE